MGGTLSHWNNKLSFDYQGYLRERNELAAVLREIAKHAFYHRQQKGTMAVINGASGLAAGVLGVVALATAPATLGLTAPVAIVGHSIAAASMASSAASYGYSQSVDKDVAIRLHNLRIMVENITTKDKEINSFFEKNKYQTKEQENQNQNHHLEACQKLQTLCTQLDLAAKDMKSMALELPASILGSQGIILGTRSILLGSQQIQSEEELEEGLYLLADLLDEETKLLGTWKRHFKYLKCITGEIRLPRGRLTYIDGGGGCSRIMVVTFYDIQAKAIMKLESDSSNVVRLPEGATTIKVHFYVKGGNTVKQVDRHHPKQPWIRLEGTGGYETEIFDFDARDGVDAVFYVEGTFTHSFVSKAYDFGRHWMVERRSWEFWENAEDECKKLIPELEVRTLYRTSKNASTNSTFDNPYFGICFCGGGYGQQVASVA